MSEIIADLIRKLEAHKGGTYTLNKSELRVILTSLKDYAGLVKKLNGDWVEEKKIPSVEP